MSTATLTDPRADLIVGPLAGPHALTRRFLDGRPKQLLIGGRWVDAAAGRTFAVVDPATEQMVASVALAEAEDVDRAVRAACRAFEAPTWAAITPAARARYLLRIADLMEAHADELGALQSLEMGQVFSQTPGMATAMADTFRYYAGWTTKLGGRTNASAPDRFNYTLREPLGVVGAIIAWNGPMLAATWKLAPALACGNTVVLKPADVAPLAVLRLAELLQEAGLPDGVVNLVPGTGQGAGEALINHPGVDKLAFTGSTAVGRRILEVSATTMKKVTLELGGKGPTIVFDDADLDRAAQMSLVGFAANTGQMCVAGSRILVQDGVYEEFADKLSAAAAAITTGSPFEADTGIGPLASAAQRDRVRDYLRVGAAEGARMLTGGMVDGQPGYFVRPTIFADVRPDMRVYREEIFGPVAALTRFATEAEAVAAGNDTEYGLSATVWTRDAGRAQRMARALRAGTVWVNTMFDLDPASPFGGYKLSGLGRELGPESIDAYTQIKSVYLGV